MEIDNLSTIPINTEVNINNKRKIKESNEVWTAAEDKVLFEAVDHFGGNKWKLIFQDKVCMEKFYPSRKR